MIIQLDGRHMTSRENAHQYLQQAFGFPHWYGRNLDALFDLLTERGEPTVVHLLHRQILEETLGTYGGLLVQTLLEAADSNPNLQIAEIAQ